MIELRNVSIHSGPFALTNVSLSVPAGAYAVLMGGTGQGKTTILEAICGLRTVTDGRVILDGTEVTRYKPADRGVGYLPQDLGLFPMMTVRGHLEFALRLRRWSTAAIRERVDELAHTLGIEQLLTRHVQRLSGGEAQRVALGRALSFRPQVLLLDEPLNSVDETTRDRLCDLLRKVQKQSRLTTLHVTHSSEEARQLADRLLILAGGELAERPIEDLDHLPANLEDVRASRAAERRALPAGRQDG
jgi:ABC-type sugar transport system ATPase subunit